MEFYFGDSNLHKDRFMKKQIEEAKDGCKKIIIIGSRFISQTNIDNEYCKIVNIWEVGVKFIL